MAVFRTILFLVHLLVLCLLLGTSLNSYVSPRSMPVLNFLSLGFPILMIVHIVLILFWLAVFRKRILVFLVGSFFLVKPTQRWINYSSKTNEKADLKVISYNTHNIKPEKEKFLNAQNVDVILLQESGWGERSKFELSNFVHSANSEVVSIYSKYPIISKGKIQMGEHIGHGLYADIRIKDKVIRFITIYLEPFQIIRDGMENPAAEHKAEDKAVSLIKKMQPIFKVHQDQILEVKDVISNSPYPVVLGGDFNAVPNSYEYYQIAELLSDAFVKVGKGSGTSFHDYIFPIRIDFVFHSKELKPIDYQIDRNIKLSDHYPVYTDFRFKE